MKKLLAMLLALVVALSLAACGSGTQNEPAPAPSKDTEDTSPESGSEAGETKALIVYFSWSGNTESVAKEIQTQTGAAIFEIVPATPYTDDYNTLIELAQEEQRTGARPEIADTIENIGDYDTVYVGFPNWWGDMPMILYTFFDRYDLSGKTVVPFVTSGGSGFSDTIATMKGLEPDAVFLEGLALGSAEAKTPASAVSDWLTQNGLR
jgi:flavodoxin/predicted small lipoprotein YifL